MQLVLSTESQLKKSGIEEALQFLEDSDLLKQIPSIVCKTVRLDIPATPFGRETFIGAKMRAETLYKRYRNSGDFFVGLESGLLRRYRIWFEECWCVILNRKGEHFFGYSSGIALPASVTAHIRLGKKHDEILDSMSKTSGYTSKETWDIYTNGVITRKASIKESFRNAFYYALEH